MSAPASASSRNGASGRMSAQGQKRRIGRAPITSGLPRQADVFGVGRLTRCCFVTVTKKPPLLQPFSATRYCERLGRVFPRLHGKRERFSSFGARNVSEAIFTFLYCGSVDRVIHCFRCRHAG